jgi:alpha-tubulin suppressor-like RCC1 family protein
LSVGTSHACAVTADKRAVCWGDNQFGQLGNGSTENSNVPVRVARLDETKAVSCGGHHCCALAVNGSLSCWGHFNGVPKDLALDGYYAATPVTIDVPVGLSVSAIAVGSDRACAILGDGSAVCFGNNEFGKLGCGDGSSHLEPVFVEGLSGAAKIVMGEKHTCALLADGTVSCWGWNAHALLGRDDPAYQYETPVQVAGLSGTVALAAGSYHTCSVSAEGSVACWGVNGNGQLGNSGTAISLPTAVSGLNAGALGACLSHSCAVLKTGAISCWGYNGYGQLGNGTTENSAAPVSVLWPTDQ